MLGTAILTAVDAPESWGGSFLVPLLLAILLGGLVGLERELHGRPAGLRTHVLVCISCTMLIHASLHLPLSFQRLIDGFQTDSSRLVIDPNRLAAGIITGIGFLGSGTVIRAGDLVRGITTAACIWFVAGVGIVIGHGNFAIAIQATAAVLIVLTLFKRIENRIPPVLYRQLVVRGSAAAMSDVATRVRAIIAAQGIRLQDLGGSRDASGGEFELQFSIRVRDRTTGPELLEELTNLEGVHSVEWTPILD